MILISGNNNSNYNNIDRRRNCQMKKPAFWVLKAGIHEELRNIPIARLYPPFLTGNPV